MFIEPSYKVTTREMPDGTWAGEVWTNGGRVYACCRAKEATAWMAAAAWRSEQEGQRDINTLMLCVASAWLYETISGARARELATALGRTIEELERLRAAEEE